MKRGKRPKGLTADTPVGEAMVAILPPQVDTILGYEAAVRARDVEGVHDMRVATKRLREAARLFRPAFGKARLTRHLEHVEALNNALGAVRELDVLGLQLDDLVARDAALTRGLRGLRSDVAERRDATDRDLEPVLDRTLPLLANDFSELLRDRPRKRREVWKSSFLDLGRSAIRERLTVASELEEAARPPAAVAEFHRLRIAVKKVKYALELFLKVIGKPARRAYRPITDLQELMGLVHDCDVLVAQISGAQGAGVTTTAARRALKLVAEDRARLHGQTMALLDEMHQARVSERLMKSLK